MSLATVGDEGPYSSPVFYATADEGQTLVFASKNSSRHIREIGRDPRASAGIFVETRELALVRGVQVCGLVRCPIGLDRKRLKAAYLRTHPVAQDKLETDSEVQIFAFEIKFAKLVDNRSGWGRPVVWSFTEEVVSSPSGPRRL